MATTDVRGVRAFRREDVPELLGLMRELAAFEGYIDEFRVTQRDLIEFGLCKTPAFRAYVAPDPETPSSLGGMAVTYRQPWTYDRRPALVLKELFVAEACRGLGLGEALMQRVREEARDAAASSIRWTVLRSNDAAKRFYARLGAREDAVWEGWVLPTRV